MRAGNEHVHSTGTSESRSTAELLHPAARACSGKMHRQIRHFYSQFVAVLHRPLWGNHTYLNNLPYFQFCCREYHENSAVCAVSKFLAQACQVSNIIMRRKRLWAIRPTHIILIHSKNIFFIFKLLNDYWVRFHWLYDSVCVAHWTDDVKSALKQLRWH